MLPATQQRWESRLYPQPKQVLDLATPEGCKAEFTCVRPRPHQQQCRSNRQHCRSNVRICRSNIRLCCHKRQQCRKDDISFDIVAETGNAETGNIVAKNGSNVEATFDTVERIVQLVAFDNVVSTLLLVWTGLYVKADRPGIEPATYKSQVQCPTTEPPRNTGKSHLSQVSQVAWLWSCCETPVVSTRQ